MKNTSEKKIIFVRYKLTIVNFFFIFYFLTFFNIVAETSFHRCGVMLSSLKETLCLYLQFNDDKNVGADNLLGSALTYGMVPLWVSRDRIPPRGPFPFPPSISLSHSLPVISKKKKIQRDHALNHVCNQSKDIMDGVR